MSAYNVDSLADLKTSVYSSELAASKPQNANVFQEMIRDVNDAISRANDAVQARASSQAAAALPAWSRQGELAFNTTSSLLFLDPDGNGHDDQLATELSAYQADFATAGTGTFKVGGQIANPSNTYGCVYASKTFSTAGQTSDSVCMRFNATGSKMYVMGFPEETIFEYDLSVAYDVSTATYNSVSHHLTEVASGFLGFWLNTAGTKLYVANSNDTIYQYSLSSAFDLSTVTYDSKSYDTSTQTSSLESIALSGDGSRLFVLGSTGPTIYSYTLSSAGDISTATYDSVSLSITGLDAITRSLLVANSGFTVVVAGTGSETIGIYNLSTAWDLSTAIKDPFKYSTNISGANPFVGDFNSAGTALSVCTSSNIRTWTLTTAFSLAEMRADATIPPLTTVGDTLVITAAGAKTITSTAATLSIIIGSTVIDSMTLPASTSGWVLKGWLTATGASSQKYTFYVKLFSDATGNTDLAVNGTSAIDMSAETTLSIGSTAGSDGSQVTLNHASVSILHG